MERTLERGCGMSPSEGRLTLALDDMSENQDGVRFQRMALQLARQTWPEIVCSEPGKDLGVDVAFQKVWRPMAWGERSPVPSPRPTPRSLPTHVKFARTIRT